MSDIPSSNHPLVSVLMLAYNHESYIAEAIEGVLSQTSSYSFELIVSEDCSTDRTREIALDYQSRYPDLIRVLYSEKNIGMMKNFTRALKACRGKYLAYCEGDDKWIDPLKLQLQIDYLEANPDCGLVYSDYDRKHETSGRIVRNYVQKSGKGKVTSPNIYDIVEKRVDIRACTVVTKTNLTRKIRKDDPYLNGENFLMGDTQSYAQISMQSKLHFIPKSLAMYRLVSESSTQSQDICKRIRFQISDAEMYMYLCKKYSLKESVYDFYRSKLIRESLHLAYYEKDVSRSQSIINSNNDITTIKDKFWYLGTRFLFFRIIIKTVKFIQDYLKKSSRIDLANDI